MRRFPAPTTAQARRCLPGQEPGSDAVAADRSRPPAGEIAPIPPSIRAFVKEPARTLPADRAFCFAPPPDPPMSHDVNRAPPSGKALLTLSLGALGVVYGDIGTSPLYALKECFSGAHSVPPTRENVLGVLSLVLWSLMFVVTVKYLSFVMRADNRGEGGVLALMALVGRQGTARRGRRAL